MILSVHPEQRTEQQLAKVGQNSFSACYSLTNKSTNYRAVVFWMLKILRVFYGFVFSELCDHAKCFSHHDYCNVAGFFVLFLFCLLLLLFCFFFTNQEDQNQSHRLYVFPQLPPVACFFALGTGCVFPFVWHRLHFSGA